MSSDLRKHATEIPIQRKDPIQSQQVDPFFDRTFDRTLVDPMFDRTLADPVFDRTLAMDPVRMVNEMMRRVDPMLRPAGWTDLVALPQTMERNLETNLGTNTIRADIDEAVDAYFIHADLPGLNKEKIKLTVEGDFLNLEAYREQKHDTRGWTTHRKECTYGKVERRFRLPEDVDVQKIHSYFEDGVLHLKMPKKNVEQKRDVKKIAVN
jgi:HSP20 family molecular chaperone IbpA